MFYINRFTPQPINCMQDSLNNSFMTEFVKNKIHINLHLFFLKQISTFVQGRSVPAIIAPLMALSYTCSEFVYWEINVLEIKLSYKNYRISHLDSLIF